MVMRAQKQADSTAAPAAAQRQRKTTKPKTGGVEAASPRLQDRRTQAAQMQALKNAEGVRPQTQALAQLANAAGNQAPIQRLGGDTRGDQAVTYGLMGTAIGARAGLYGAAVGGVLGTAYGYLSGYSTYSNHQKDAYRSELGTYLGWKARVAEGATAYESGEIFTYSSGNADTIHGMLNEGQVMYTYDVDSRLRVSGNHDAIKHSLLAEDKDVYAAGTASLDDPTKLQLGEAIKLARDRDLNAENMSGLRKGSEQQGYFDRLIHEAEAGLQRLGEAPDVSVGDLIHRYDNHAVRKAASKLDVTEDSGHYSPTYDSGHKAVEAWTHAGYPRVSWKPRWRQRRFFQTTVQDTGGG